MESGVPLSISIAGLLPEAGTPWTNAAGRIDARAAIEWVAGCGVRGVQLDATLDSIRPRQLDRSARRDLASILRRQELSLSGVDLWIPSEHFVEPAHAQRAIDALLAAIEFAGELTPLVGAGSRAIVSTLLPELLDGGVLAEIERFAGRLGVRVANHRPERDRPAQSAPVLLARGVPTIGAGVDPAGALLAGVDPAQMVVHAGERLVSPRLSDASTTARVEPLAREARLDLLAYHVALTTVGHAAHRVIDVRGVADQSRVPAAWIERLERTLP